jgi:hypothetical protein
MSTIVYNSCEETDVVAHVCGACDDSEAGGISSLAAIHKRYYDTLIANPDDEAVWQTGIANGDIIIIPDTKGSMSSTPTFKTGVGRTLKKLTGREFKITAEDPNWKNNHVTYNGLQESRSYHVAWFTETQGQISKSPATWTPDEIIEEDIKSERAWKVEAEFSQKQFSIPFDMPQAILDCFVVTA